MFLVKVGPAAMGWSLFAVFIFLFIRGELITARQVQAMRDDADKRVAQAEKEADRWHTAFNLRGVTIDALVQQNGQLMIGAKVATDVAAALPPAAKEAST
jgi:hypothetical protein